MKSLANLSYLSSIKEICENHPKFLYFICYWGTQGRFPIKNIIDCQEDCKMLSKLGITNYDPPYERVTHSITYQSCNFTYLGEDVLEQLLNEGICEELQKIIEKTNNSESNELVDQEDFEKKFYDLFTFEPLEDNLLDIEYNKIREVFNFIHIAPRNHRVERNHCSFKIDCSIEEDVFHFILNFRCKCLNSFEMKIKEYEHHFQHWVVYKKECDNCGKKFFISPNFYDLDFISP